MLRNRIDNLLKRSDFKNNSLVLFPTNYEINTKLRMTFNRQQFNKIRNL
jgi:hypothetical protein